jgi:hypothetical protein
MAQGSRGTGQADRAAAAPESTCTCVPVPDCRKGGLAISALRALLTLTRRGAPLWQRRTVVNPSRSSRDSPPSNSRFCATKSSRSSLSRRTTSPWSSTWWHSVRTSAARPSINAETGQLPRWSGRRTDTLFTQPHDAGEQAHRGPPCSGGDVCACGVAVAAPSPTCHSSSLLTAAEAVSAGGDSKAAEKAFNAWCQSPAGKARALLTKMATQADGNTRLVAAAGSNLTLVRAAEAAAPSALIPPPPAPPSTLAAALAKALERDPQQRQQQLMPQHFSHSQHPAKSTAAGAAAMADQETRRHETTDTHLSSITRGVDAISSQYLVCGHLPPGAVSLTLLPSARTPRFLVATGARGGLGAARANRPAKAKPRLGFSGGRSLTRPFRRARRSPSTRW